MPDRIKRRLVEILFIDPTKAELTSAGMVALIGIWLVPWWQDFDTAIYRLMAGIAGQWVWALGLFWIGSHGLVALFFKWRWQRTISAGTCGLVWLTIAGFAAMTNIDGLIPVLCMWQAVAAAVTSYSVARLDPTHAPKGNV